MGYLLVFLGSLAVSVLLTPIAIRVATRYGIVDRPSPQKFHPIPTPYLGGLAVAATVIVGVFVPGNIRGESLVILGAALFVGGVGLVDDWRTLQPAPRLASQIVASTALWMAGVQLTPFGWAPLDFAATVFVVVAVTNSLNLLDNMDGMVPGTAAIAAAFFFAVAFWQGQILVALLGATLAGACLGFLPYNLGPARIFLGDAGTLFIGFILATIAIKIDLPGYPFITRAAVPWLILAVPLFDTSLVVFSRLRGGRPVFQGATDHSSHRIVALGATTRQAAVITYLVAAFAGGTAMVLLVAHVTAVTVGVIVLALAAAAGLAMFLERVELGTTGTRLDAGASSRPGPT